MLSVAERNEMMVIGQTSRLYRYSKKTERPSVLLWIHAQ